MVLSVDDLMSQAEICCPVHTKPGYCVVTDSLAQIWWLLSAGENNVASIVATLYGGESSGRHA
jgi:hypothetical protein